ncbi:A/G-specific adenine glycosylase, partial [Candidatus Woesebacteria bacterium]|nr:A/G-specific adenine glycosylase [Candidatus Woesebacteria bacterium]
MDTQEFNQFIWNYYKDNKRILPWREIITPYGVVVSELMLQQTQVPRVLVKYPEFLVNFPDFESLAQAPFEKLLRVWQGMGYNRRAKYLQQIAQKIIEEYSGVVSDNPAVLETLPGIGPATARSIITYIYNKPEIFIETNIRRIYIHHFFSYASNISDKQLYPFIEKTVDKKNPREWYYA